MLETSRLWREVVTRVVRDEFPQVRLEHVYVDAMAMYLVTRPRDFEVVVTENLFGDVLTDEAGVLGALLLRHALGREDAAAMVETAVEAAIADGVLTPDLPSGGEPACTAAATDAVVARLAPHTLARTA